MTRIRNLHALLLAALLLTGSATAAVAAQAAPPMRLYGTATMFGQPAAAGTVIQALVGASVCGTSTVGAGGSYRLDVSTAAPGTCAAGGALVSFTVGGLPARETALAQPGAFVPLDLTVAAVAPPVVTPATELVPLFAGCTNVVTTWPGTTPTGTVAAAVSPPGALMSIWRYDAAARRFLGYAAHAPSVSDLTVVSRLDAVFICMTMPGTLTRPIA